MKQNHILVFLLTLSMMSISSCNMSDVIIQASVTQSNSTCPVEMGNGMTLTGVEYTGLYVTYMIKCDENQYSLSQDKATEEMKQQLISTLRSQAIVDKNSKKFVDALKKNQTGIIYHYYVPNSGSPMDIIIKHDEL